VGKLRRISYAAGWCEGQSALHHDFFNFNDDGNRAAGWCEGRSALHLPQAFAYAAAS